MNIDHGVQLCSASSPSSQNMLSNAALNPDIIDEFFWQDNVGNPLVERKFQNKMCGALNGLL
jgi:hypothetical protein